MAIAIPGASALILWIVHQGKKRIGNVKEYSLFTMPATMQRKRKRSYSRVKPTNKKAKMLTNKKVLFNKMEAVQRIRGIDFLPNKMLTKFNYTEKITFANVTSPQTYIYRGNGCFDPNQTGTGSQPIGYDQMAAFYTHCEAYNSQIKIQVTNLATSGVEVITMPVPNTGDVPTFATGENYPGAKKIYVDIAGSGGAQKRISNYSTTFNVTGLARGHPDVRPAFGANPSQQWYWVTTLSSIDGASFITIVLDFTITYYVLLSGRKVVNLS